MILTPEQRAKRGASLRRFFQENPGARQKIAEHSRERKWYHNLITGETRHCNKSPGVNWKLGRPIDYLGAPWWTNGVVNCRSFTSPGPEWGRGMTNDHRKRKFQCTITDHISSPGGLTKYQRSRGIDPSNRVQVN
jgi:hypothetical protein